MTEKQNIASEPLVSLDEDKLLGLSQIARVSAPDTERPISELSRLLSKIGETQPG